MGWTGVRPVLPGLLVVALGAALAAGVDHVVRPVSSLTAAVAIGVLVANLGLLPTSARDGCQLAATRLMRAGIVLLGFRVAVGDALALGAPALAVVAAVVGLTFVGTRWIGRLLGLSPGLSLLLATGFSICGASAVTAMGGATDADDGDVAYAIALVTLCGTLAMLVLPVAAQLLGMDAPQLGAWAGASVHDVAQVVATAGPAGTEALHAAVVVKLTRVVLLAPMVAAVVVVARRSATNAGAASAAGPRPPVVPLFVVGFLAAVATRSTGALSTGWLDAVRSAESVLLAAGLVGLGTGVSLTKLRRIGGRPVLLAALAWIVVAGTSLVGVVAVIG